MSLNPVVELEGEACVPDVEVRKAWDFFELWQDEHRGSDERDLIVLTRQQAEKLMMALDLMLSEGEDE